MPEHVLGGCHPEPLGSYLKALGIFRLVSEQLDPAVRGHWRGDHFVLRTSLNAGELATFFLAEWQPSPLVSPWNNGAGFAREGKSPAAVESVAGVERSTAARLAVYRSTIVAARVALAMASDKVEVVRECRAWLPDEALPWLDAAVVLASAGPAYPPLLGSGGNLGRLELSVNFMQHLARVMSFADGGEVPGASPPWLHSAVFGGSPVRMVTASAGQFDPGMSGGVSTSPLGKAEGLVNPWDFILTIEGTLAFAGSVSRRMGSVTKGTAAMPFTVDSTPVGYADACAGEGTRGELWAPLWGRPAAWPEIERLLGEGRAQWGRQQARSGLDFVRATASLGVDRGIQSFARHAIVERLGQNMLAVPVGRVAVHVKPAVPLLHAVDAWVERLRWEAGAPAQVTAALRRLEAVQFEMASKGGGLRLQEVLIALAELEAVVARATSFRDRSGLRPVVGLPAHEWLPLLEADGASVELRLAAGLASLCDPIRSDQRTTSVERDAGRLSLFVRPVSLGDRQRLGWATAGAKVPGLTARPLVEVLAEAHRQRVIRVVQGGGEQLVTDEHEVGVQPAFAHGIKVPRQDVARLVAGGTDDATLGRLLAGMLLLEDWRCYPQPRWGPEDGSTGPLLPAWAVLAPFFEHGNPRLRPQTEWVAQLAAGQVDQVLTAALMRLRMAGDRQVLVRNVDVMAAGVEGPRVAAGLLVRLSKAAYASLLDQASAEAVADYP